MSALPPWQSQSEFCSLPRTCGVTRGPKVITKRWSFAEVSRLRPALIVVFTSSSQVKFWLNSPSKRPFIVLAVTHSVSLASSKGISMLFDLVYPHSREYHILPRSWKTIPNHLKKYQHSTQNILLLPSLGWLHCLRFDCIEQHHFLCIAFSNICDEQLYWTRQWWEYWKGGGGGYGGGGDGHSGSKGEGGGGGVRNDDVGIMLPLALLGAQIGSVVELFSSRLLRWDYLSEGIVYGVISLNSMCKALK